MSRKAVTFIGTLLALCIPASSTATAAPSYTLNLTFEVIQKYPGVDAPENVINGCRDGFPMDEVFTENARWEILGSKKEIVATGVVNKVSVKNVKKVAGPFLDENDESYQPYIFNGTCVYTSKIKVPKSSAYRFKFADVDLKTSYSFSELTKKKWKLTIKTDLNCDGLYGKKCSFTSK